jgi:hypothetical protein
LLGLDVFLQSGRAHQIHLTGSAFIRHNYLNPHPPWSQFRASKRWKGLVLTLEELLDHAASECIDKRESYLVVFTVGINAYVCPNEGAIHPGKALFEGTYRACQIWVERQGIAQALRCVLARIGETPVNPTPLSSSEFLDLIIRSTN